MDIRTLKRRYLLRKYARLRLLCRPIGRHTPRLVCTLPPRICIHMMQNMAEF